MLKNDDSSRSSAKKRLDMFGVPRHEGGCQLTGPGFEKLVVHLQETLGFQPDDARLMKSHLQRWRFRANAARGQQGCPLWPLSDADFTAAWPSLLRVVRDRYVPIGGQLHRSLFIRKAAGQLTDKYTVGKKLGRGAYGEVSLVSHKVTNQKRVCKRIERRCQKMSAQQIMAEVEILTSLDHPHIIRLFEFFDSEVYFDMIFEPVFAGTLTQTVGLYSDDNGNLVEGKRPDGLSEGWIATILSQLLGALTYAHDVVGVIHKDLKTDNVLLVGAPYLTAAESLKQPVHAMLADFGVSEFFRKSSTQSTTWISDAGDVESYAALGKRRLSSLQSPSVPRSTQVGGTPLYMSPEMFAGSFTEKCDVWSLGVIVFQLLTGDVPYRGSNILTQGMMVSNTRRHPNWDLVTKNKWSLGARWFCQQLLSKEEATRPSASTAQQDPWIQKLATQHCNVAPTKDEVDAFQRQSLRSHLMKMVLHCVTSQINLSQMHYLNLRFKKYDVQTDGRLNHVEMRQALQDAGITDATDVELVIESLDADHSGFIEYSEFVAGCLNLSKDSVREQLRMAFDVFDIDGNGFITLSELSYILAGGGDWEATDEAVDKPNTKEDMCILLPDGKTVEEVMADMDSDKSGKVSYEEFETYLLKEHMQTGLALHNKSASADVEKTCR